MITRRIYTFCLLLFVMLPVVKANPVSASSFSLDLITTGIGADTENSTALRDQYGFLWLGTKNGLQCYDGNGRAVYAANSEPLRQLSNLHVSALYEDGNDLLIGGNSGLYVFCRSRNTISSFPYATRYGVTISSLVDKIADAGQGRIWISTQGQGFFIYNKANGTLKQDSRHGSFYSDMAIGSDGLIYLVSINGHIQTFTPDGNMLSESRLPDYTPDKNKLSMVSLAGNIWVSAGTNLYRLNTSSKTIERVTLNKVDIINAMLARDDHTLLLGTNNGLWSCPTASPGELTPIVHGDTPKDIRVSNLQAEPGGDIIIVHPEGAVEILSRQSPAFRFVGLPATYSRYSRNTLSAITPDSGNAGLWVGTENGLYYYDLQSGQFSEIALPGAGHSKSVTSLMCSGSKLWIGTKSSGIIVYDTKEKSHKHYVYDENKPYALISNEINCIYRTRGGDVYVLTNWGMCRYDAEADNFPQLLEFGQQIHGVTMTEDNEGVLWIATANNGVFSRAEGQTRFRNVNENIPATLMHLDHTGRLWAATLSNGLFRYDRGADDFKQCDISLLNNQQVSFMIDDKTGALWIGTRDMLLKLDSEGNAIMHDFGRNVEWLPVTGATLTLHGGNHVIGCRNGFFFFDNDAIETCGDKIRTYAHSISFPFFKGSSDELEQLGLNTLLYTQKEIDIPYDNNTFTLHLSASRPASLPNVRYDYMLEGIDRTWITGISGADVTYNNLAHGSYTFLLRPHGVNNAEVFRLKINILPPWYLTTWAYTVYLLLAIVVLWLTAIVVRHFVRKKYHRQLHEMRIQKEREVFQAKTRYFVDLVHEIRTPLMLISLPLEQLAEDENTTQPVANQSRRVKYIKSMQHNIDYLLGITNQLLDFRRAENSREIRLSIVQCNVKQMLLDTCRRFDEPLKISGKVIATNVPDDDVIANIDTDKTQRLLMNLLGNAMKYASHAISVTLSHDNGNFSIAVADDGPGVPHNEQDKIFDTYYQIGNDNVAASLGTGLGLAYAKLIAVTHKGNITVTDNPGGGAVFTLTMPKNEGNTPAQTEVTLHSDEPAAEVPASSDKAILIVEDNDELREMITESLGRHYTVITAIDGCMALDILASNDISVIVSDVMMPRMNGLELCRKVKTDINYSHIPFIMLTAKTGREAQAEGMECGADVYLEKPFPIKHLAYQIANMLNTRKQLCERLRKDLGNNVHSDKEELPANTGLNRIDTEFMEKMNVIITESIANEEFSIDRLAEQLNMSRSSFYRKITAITGMTPSDYLKNYRLNYAATLIADGCRISEVSDRVGFASSYFARCFKEKFGMLPSEYAQMQSTAGRTENRQ